MFTQRNRQTFAATPDFLQQALIFAQEFEVCCLTDGNAHLFTHYPHQPFRTLLAIGAKELLPTKPEKLTHLEWLQSFQTQAQDYVFGFLSYDLKNEIENLQSQNPAAIHFPPTFWFVPQHLIEFDEQQITIYTFDNPQVIYQQICATNLPLLATNAIQNGEKNKNKTLITCSLTKEDYIQSVEQIKQNIREGEVYELNFCLHFSAQQKISPVAAYWQLKTISPMPFACFFKYQNLYLIGASPERFLKKEGQQIISQPIKGTVKRGKTPEEDQLLQQQLKNSEKERAENLMIVDLVRNDFARTAQTGSIKVEELFGIYGFAQVSQMISTVVATVASPTLLTTIIKNAFPMGSMTGAPKIRAMQLIDHYETHQRGLFSGAVGYFTPTNDFDLNVVIRTIFYDDHAQTINFMAGSAITYDSDAAQEYEECLLKTQAIRKVLNSLVSC